MTISGISSIQGISPTDTQGDMIRAVQQHRRTVRAMTDLDSDKSGGISSEEFAAGAQKMKEKAAAQGLPGPQKSPEEVFAELDKNGDSSLSFEELAEIAKNPPPGQAIRRMKRLDADENGEVSEEEFTAEREARAAQAAALGLPAPQTSAAEAFANLDKDGNSTLSFQEVAAIGHPRPPQPPSPGQMMKQFDADQSGSISSEEFLTEAQRMADNAAANGLPGPRIPPAEVFASLDKNGDSSLSFEELAALAKPPPPPSPGQVMKQFDADQSGSVSSEEFLTEAQRMAEHAAANGLPSPQVPPEEVFASLDKNGDSSLSFQELSVLARPPKPPPMQQILNQVDTDKSGNLSLEEFTAEAKRLAERAEALGLPGPQRPAEEVFAELDQNGDQILSFEELAAPAKPPAPPAPPSGAV